ncbi:hypothetical protein [Nesterenkonia alba]|uniref:hypothetical protein n=1 Tax=Nesterenkonia alba TaxID=515814 RepID=UPI0003B2FB93|nr:hypothetical protein [Nesterenkonia alba]
MVIHTERSPAEEGLIAAFRARFDASVMNFGAYNLLYAENALAAAQSPGEEISAQENLVASRHLLVGYRREPAEMVLCPVNLEEVLTAAAGADVAISRSVPVPVNLTNLAGLAAEDSEVEIALSTGRRVKLQLREQTRFTSLPEVPLNQHRDVEDFYAFLDHFMDAVERVRA